MAGETPDVGVDSTSDVNPEQLATALAHGAPVAQEEQAIKVSEEKPGVVGLPADFVLEREGAGSAVRRLPRSAD
ncbi:hypothetical protein [Streptomyces longispororuber]|uniref:hypothetical protein n=1 Tax=Streptomyces longispororuber TaxID=68230 RepID=UPI0036F679D5